MDIKPLTLDDDAEMRAAFEVNRDAELVGREQAPHWSFENFLGAMRSTDSGERMEAFVGYVDGDVVSFGVTYLFLLDNTDKAYVEVRVDPAHQGKGHGRQMLEHLMAIAEDDGRTQILAETKVPIDEVETHPNSRFLKANGFIHANVELVRYLMLPVEDADIQTWVDSAAEKHAGGYRIETFDLDIPAELVPSLCVLMGQLAVDAPSGEVDFEEEVITPERYAEHQAMIKAMGRTVLETLAIAPDGTVAAQSTLSIPLDDSGDVWQWGTFVHREHRGRRLGLATKAANLRALQTQFPGTKRIVTQNAETNAYMVSINELMGFGLVEASAEFVRRSEPAPGS
ncbi:MAG TPA: GNAT family N-acetyltransferase [Nocardioides sp.]|nr:GNAT family N-acetyltransferase [Nocardioides sp.]